MTPPKDTIYVWSADFTDLLTSYDKLTATLSSDERQRAGSFGHETARKNFELSRGMLRMLLGNSLFINPKDVTFKYGEHGKPALSSATEIEFNLSHSANIAVVALTTHTQIGVDVEKIRELSREDLFARKLLSASELEHYEKLESGQKRSWLFQIWVMKEAVGKAAGKGISLPLTALEARHPSWNVETFVPRAGYQGAIAYSGRLKKIVYGDWRIALEK